MVELFDRAIKELLQAVENSLSKPSSNPLFLFDVDMKAKAYSQSSFLDFRLSDSVRVLGNALVVAANWLARVIQHVADDIESKGTGIDVAWTVQYPKVATALAHEVRSYYPEVTSLVVTSGGVEDMVDGTLSAVVSVNSQIDVLEKIVGLYEDMVSRV